MLDRAVLDTQLWRAVCDKLAEFLGGVGAAFVPEDVALQGPWLVSSASLSELIAAIFRDDWHLRNYRRRAIPIIKRQGVATDFDIADAATMRREPFYTELLAPQKIGNFIGLNVEVGRQTWIASVERGTDAAPPDQALKDRALRVLPYLAAAVRSSFALGHNRLESWNDLIAEEDRGVFLVDYLGRIIDRNEASEAFLKTALRIRNRTLQLGDSRRNVQFHVWSRRRARRNRREPCPRPCFGRMKAVRCLPPMRCASSRNCAPSTALKPRWSSSGRSAGAWMA